MENASTQSGAPHFPFASYVSWYRSVTCTHWPIPVFGASCQEASLVPKTDGHIATSHQSIGRFFTKTQGCLQGDIMISWWSQEITCGPKTLTYNTLNCWWGEFPLSCLWVKSNDVSMSSELWKGYGMSMFQVLHREVQSSYLQRISKHTVAPGSWFMLIPVDYNPKN